MTVMGRVVRSGGWSGGGGGVGLQMKVVSYIQY